MIKARLARSGSTASPSWVCRSCSALPKYHSLRSIPVSRCLSTTSAESAGTRKPIHAPPPPNRRPLATASAAAPVDTSISHVHDDQTLRDFFDVPRSNIMASIASWAQKSAGLFNNRFLTNPQGFITFAQINLEKAQAIVRKVAEAHTIAAYSEIVRDLDRLSDLLCRVLDLCDFVRMTHPDTGIQEAASHAWAMAYQYMNELNTMPMLHDQLDLAINSPAVSDKWTDEERAVAEILRNDFRKSGIHLPTKQRTRFVDLTQKISKSGTIFVSQAEPAISTLTLPASSFVGLYPQLASSMTHNGKLHLPLLGREAALAQRTVTNEDCRKAIYSAQRTASQNTIRALEDMLKARAELANLVGFQSYSDHALRDRMMARNPSDVKEFLMALRKHNLPLAQQELDFLTARKQQHVKDPKVKLNSWDKDFYIQSTRNEMREKDKYQSSMDDYFSVGTVMQGMSRLFNRLYGIRFVPGDTETGETWHPEVRRLDVIDDHGNKLAVLYCDLFSRPGKASNPAHYTLRCAREIPQSEIVHAASRMGSYGLPPFTTPEEAANDGMASAVRDGVLRQLPTIALVCDFHKDSNARGKKPATLDFHQVETLFHEMGHAVHSILAQTKFQNVAGTRCATDLAELPSTLMEHFAADPSVLGLFARHWQTDEPLPYQMVAHKIRLEKRFEGLDTEHQLILALLDQEYHSGQAGQPGFKSTPIFAELERKYAVAPPDPQGTCWQGFFGHLYGYGATYYSYLFDRVLAERVWRKVFKAGEGGGAVNRENGEQFKENLLRWGGSRDPWKCVADTLQDERLENGGKKAMAIVGSWGIKDDHVKMGL